MTDVDGGSEVDGAALARYVAGEASPDECRRVEWWLSVSARHRRELAELRWLWERSAALPGEAHVDRMWGALAARMRE